MMSGKVTNSKFPWIDEMLSQSTGMKKVYNAKEGKWEETNEKVYVEDYVFFYLTGDDSINKDKPVSDLEKWLIEHNFKFITSDGGGEGGTQYCYAVFELDGVLYKGEYSYYSYDGFDYDSFFTYMKVVQPKEKTITVYE